MDWTNPGGNYHHTARLCRAWEHLHPNWRYHQFLSIPAPHLCGSGHGCISDRYGAYVPASVTNHSHALGYIRPTQYCRVTSLWNLNQLSHRLENTR
ncbi:hypothetical protein BJV74DRAFT_401884 [Russula compacta]|nr:hypothetical protein BJV74DRAFT_401884 [Russula compacta]